MFSGVGLSITVLSIMKLKKRKKTTLKEYKMIWLCLLLGPSAVIFFPPIGKMLDNIST